MVVAGAVSVPCGLRSAVVIRTTRSFSFQKADMKPAADRGPNDHAHRARTDTARGGRAARGRPHTDKIRYTHDAPTCAPADRCMHIIHSVSCPHAPYILGCKCGMPLCKHPETEPAAAHPPVEVSCQASYRSTRRPGHLTVSLTETYPGAACRDYTCTAGAPTAPPRSRSYAPRYQ